MKFNPGGWLNRIAWQKPSLVTALTPEASAHAMVVTIEQVKPEQNGKFLARDGTEIPW